MSDTPKLSLYRRLTGSVPILVTVIIHALVIGVAGYFVTETIIGKKKTFEEAPPMDTAFKKQVEHRLQVARKAGGAAPSPISAQRIVSTAADALQLPEMPQLPQVGASSLSSMGFGASMGTVGMGSGNNTGLGNGGGGSGFMSLSFLGVTTQRVQKIVFVVDVSKQMMDIKKDGFDSFEIIRSRMMYLVRDLSPSAQFGVVLFSRADYEDEQSRLVKLFRSELLPATLENKKAFLEWMKPINADPSLATLGFASAPDVVDWTFTAPPNAGLNEEYRPTPWINGFQAALELKPDTVFVITAATSVGTLNAPPAVLAERARQIKKITEDLKKEGIDYATAEQARGAALTKAKADLDAINKKLVSQGKPPFVVENLNRLYANDFQAAVKKAGFNLPIDGTGWTTKAGRRITESSAYISRTYEPAKYDDMRSHISRLQAALVREPARLNIFFFVGPNQDTKVDAPILSKIARANGGSLEILDAAKLKALKASDK